MDGPTAPEVVDGTAGPHPVDGRRARRRRGQQAVVEALIALADEGHLPPTAELIAERAGVSNASLFRYFSSLDELHRRTLEYFFATHAELFELPEPGTGDLTARVEHLVAQRIRLFERTAGPARLARLRAPEHPTIAEGLVLSRRRLSAQVAAQLEPELCRLTPAVRADRVALVDSLLSFESWDLLVLHHGRTRRQVRRAWNDGVCRLVTGSGGPAAGPKGPGPGGADRGDW